MPEEPERGIPRVRMRDRPGCPITRGHQVPAQVERNNSRPLFGPRLDALGERC